MWPLHHTVFHYLTPWALCSTANVSKQAILICQALVSAIDKPSWIARYLGFCRVSKHVPSNSDIHFHKQPKVLVFSFETDNELIQTNARQVAFNAS